MSRTLIPLLFLAAFPLLTYGQEDDETLADLLSKWDNATTYTLAIADAMPPELYNYRPTEDIRTFSEQLIHIADNMIWLCSTYLGGTEFSKEQPEGKTEVIDYVSRSLTYARETLAGLDLNTLDEYVQFFAGPMSKRRVILLLNDHQTHHRGQLILYLRLKGIQPARYMGW